MPLIDALIWRIFWELLEISQTNPIAGILWKKQNVVIIYFLQTDCLKLPNQAYSVSFVKLTWSASFSWSTQVFCEVVVSPLLSLLDLTSVSVMDLRKVLKSEGARSWLNPRLFEGEGFASIPAKIWRAFCSPISDGPGVLGVMGDSDGPIELELFCT